MPLDPLAQVIRQFENQPRWQQQHQFRQVLSCWLQVVGNAVAGQTRPTHIERQVLYVAVANPMWGQTLTLERWRILASLNRQLTNPLNDIRFSSGGWGGKSWKSRRQLNPGLTKPTTIPDWLRHHPSYDPTVQRQIPPAQGPQTAVESFQQWAIAVQRADRHQPVCPACGCHCPAGELKRWSVCGICAAARWR